MEWLKLERGGACTLQVGEHLVDDHTDGAYAVLRFTGTCPSHTQALALNYRLLFDIDQLHRGLLRLELDGVAHTRRCTARAFSSAARYSPCSWRWCGWRSGCST